MIPHRLHSLSSTLLVAVFAASVALFPCAAWAGNGGGGVGVAADRMEFGVVPVGVTVALPNKISNHSPAAVTISEIQTSGPEFRVVGIKLPAVLGPGETAPFSVLFQPKTPGVPAATIAFEGVGEVPYAALLATGMGVSTAGLSSNPSPVTFENVEVGAQQTTPVTLSNGSAGQLVITHVTLNGAGFSMSDLSLPLTLAAGQTLSFTVTFTPTRSGLYNGKIMFASNSGNHDGRISMVALALSGTALNAGGLVVKPSRISFGSVSLGSTSTRTESLINTGGVTITVSQATAGGAAYSLQGLTLPMTLAPGQSVPFTVVFTPTAGGVNTGIVNITSDDANPNLTMALSGTAVAPGLVNANPTNANFGKVMVGSTHSLPVTVANTGGQVVTVSSAATTGSGFSFPSQSLPVTLNAGQSTTLNVVFTPSAAGAASGALTITSDASNAALSIPLTGTAVSAGQLATTPASLSFGNVQNGTSASLAGSLTNTGGTSVTITAATASSGFGLSGMALPLALDAGQSAPFTVTFSPTASGAATGSVSFLSNAANASLSLPLSGTGVTQGSVAPSPTLLAFGSVQVGQSSTLPETLTNSGGTSVTISAATVSGAGFTLSGLSLPATLTPGQTASFSVLFAPTVSGAASGSVSITSTGSDSSFSIPLSGTGATLGNLTATSATLAFGNVQVGSTTSLPETLTNSGGSSVTISAASATGAGFTLTGLALPLTLNAGQSASFNVAFSPTTTGAAAGTLNLTANGSTPNLTIPLTGTGQAAGTLTANPASLAFGSVQVGGNASLSATVTNSGGSTVTISQATPSGAGWTISGLTVPATLAAGQSVTFSVTFAPTASGAVSGSLSIASNATNATLNLALSGTGAAAGALAATPGSLSFGNVVVGATGTLNESVTASGGPVTINSASLSNGAFLLSGLSLPLTLASGQSATFTVTFTPQASGAAAGSLTFSSNASNSPAVESLTGTGSAAVQHSAALAWNAASGAVGYNVYRSTTSGGPYVMINTSLDGGNGFSDTTVVSGQTYYYVTTMVDSQSNESGYSNQVQAVIPSP